MIYAFYLLLPVSAFIVSIVVNKLLLANQRKIGLLDIPNERSSHKIPVPRGGGLGIFAGVFINALIYAGISNDFKLILIVTISGLIGIIGLVDDIKHGIKAGLRFGLQLACTLIIILIFGPIDVLPLPSPLHFQMPYYGIIISLIWLIGITNIFNFLDGIDGYAGMQGFIGGLMLSIISWGSPISIIGLLISLSCAGFLLFNWPPARIFMGDVGSSFLGFLFAALPFYLKDSKGFELRSELFFGTAVILWFFLLDGTFTIFRRLLKKEKIWEAHRSHLYQRLVISGMSHSEVVMTVGFFYAILFLVLLFYMVQPKISIIQWPVLITGFGLFLLYIYYTMLREKARLKKIQKS